MASYMNKKSRLNKTTETTTCAAISLAVADASTPVKFVGKAQDSRCFKLVDSAQSSVSARIVSLTSDLTYAATTVASQLVTRERPRSGRETI